MSELQDKFNNQRFRHELLLSSMGDGLSFPAMVHSNIDNIKQMIDCDGIAVVTDGHCNRHGDCISLAEIRVLLEWLNRQSANRVISAVSLQSQAKELEEWVTTPGGFLAIPLSRFPRDYLIFFSHT